MNTIDLILIICFIPALIKGYKKGFISQLLSFCALIFGIIVSYRFAKNLHIYLNEYLSCHSKLLYLISYLLIFCIVIVIFELLSKLFNKIVSVLMLEWLNKVLGIFFAILNTALIIGIFIMVFNTLNLEFHLAEEEFLRKSYVYCFLKDFIYFTMPFLKNLLQ